MPEPNNADAGVFDYRSDRKGDVTIYWHGRPVTTLRNRAAARFLGRIESPDDGAAQLEMAKITGNFRRGNERTGKSHERRKT